MPLSQDLLDHLDALPEDEQRKAEHLLRVHLGLDGPNGKRRSAAG